jgi:hypothetical protein
VSQRNSSAHDTEDAFASLLNSVAFRGSGAYQTWKDAFPLLYNRTIEELAEGFDEAERPLNRDLGLP